MVREIITPQNATVTLQLPDEMIGRQVEIIAFEIGDKEGLDVTQNTNGFNRNAFIDSLKNYRVDLSGFVFNRNEANDYD